MEWVDNVKKLEEVVAKRNELEIELSSLKDLKMYLAQGRKFSDLNSNEKQEYGHLLTSINMLTVQINTLSYVINYDTKLVDVTERPKYHTARVDHRLREQAHIYIKDGLLTKYRLDDPYYNDKMREKVKLSRGEIGYLANNFQKVAVETNGEIEYINFDLRKPHDCSSYSMLDGMER